MYPCPLVLSLLLAGCFPPDPASAPVSVAVAPQDAPPVAAEDADPLAPLVSFPTRWTRLAYLEGAWVAPPETSATPPVEIDAAAGVLTVRSGAGLRTWRIVAVVAEPRSGAAAGGLRLQLDEAGAEARFVPWAMVPAPRPEVEPPPGAWAIALPGQVLAADVAWYAVIAL